MTIALKNHIRNNGAVISTDLTGYEIVKRERARKKNEDGLRKEVDQLRTLVIRLQQDIEGLKKRG